MELKNVNSNFILTIEKYLLSIIFIVLSNVFVFGQNKELPTFYIWYPRVQNNIYVNLSDPNCIFQPYRKEKNPLELSRGFFDLTKEKYIKFNRQISAISMPPGYFAQIFQEDGESKSIFITSSIANLKEWNDKISYIKTYGPYVTVTNTNDDQLFLIEGTYSDKNLKKNGINFTKIKSIVGDTSTYRWRPAYTNTKDFSSITIERKDRTTYYINKERNPMVKIKTNIPMLSITPSAVINRSASNLIMDKNYQAELDALITNSAVDDIIRIVADSIQLDTNIQINDREVEIFCNFFTSRNYRLYQRSKELSTKRISLFTNVVINTILSTNGSDGGVPFYSLSGDDINGVNFPWSESDHIINTWKEINSNLKSAQDAGNIIITYLKKENVELFSSGGIKSQSPPYYIFGSDKRQVVTNSMPPKLLNYQIKEIQSTWIKPKQFYVLIPTKFEDNGVDGKDGMIKDEMVDTNKMNEIILEKLDGLSLDDLKGMPAEIQIIPHKASLTHPIFFNGNNFTGEFKIFNVGKHVIPKDSIMNFHSLRIPKGFHVLAYEGANATGKEYYFTHDESDISQHLSKISYLDIRLEEKPGSGQSGYVFVPGRFSLEQGKYKWRSGSWQKKKAGQ